MKLCHAAVSPCCCGAVTPPLPMPPPWSNPPHHGRNPQLQPRPNGRLSPEPHFNTHREKNQSSSQTQKLGKSAPVSLPNLDNSPGPHHRSHSQEWATEVTHHIHLRKNLVQLTHMNSPCHFAISHWLTTKKPPAKSLLHTLLRSLDRHDSLWHTNRGRAGDRRR